MGIDSHTGQEVGVAQFSSASAKIEATYWVATTSDKLFVYLGDSQELIAFEMGQ